jgi:hypothetical protein
VRRLFAFLADYDFSTGRTQLFPFVRTATHMYNTDWLFLCSFFDKPANRDVILLSHVFDFNCGTPPTLSWDDVIESQTAGTDEFAHGSPHS